MLISFNEMKFYVFAVSQGNHVSFSGLVQILKISPQCAALRTSTGEQLRYLCF